MSNREILVCIQEIQLEEANKVAREDIPTLLPAILIQELAAPPTIFRCSSDSNDIACLEIKLFVDSRGIVIQRFHYGTSKHGSVALR